RPAAGRAAPPAASGRATGCRWPPPSRLPRGPRSVLPALPEQRVAAAAGIALLAHQHVQADAGQVVGDRLHVQVLLLVEDLAVAAAVLAGFRLDRLGLHPLRAVLDVVVGDALRL